MSILMIIGLGLHRRNRDAQNQAAKFALVKNVVIEGVVLGRQLRVDFLRLARLLSVIARVLEEWDRDERPRRAR